jgi:hypothetical protein
MYVPLSIEPARASISGTSRIPLWLESISITAGRSIASRRRVSSGSNVQRRDPRVGDEVRSFFPTRELRRRLDFTG